MMVELQSTSSPCPVDRDARDLLHQRRGFLLPHFAHFDRIVPTPRLGRASTSSTDSSQIVLYRRRGTPWPLIASMRSFEKALPVPMMRASGTSRRILQSWLPSATGRVGGHDVPAARRCCPGGRRRIPGAKEDVGDSGESVGLARAGEGAPSDLSAPGEQGVRTDRLVHGLSLGAGLQVVVGHVMHGVVRLGDGGVQGGEVEKQDATSSHLARARNDASRSARSRWNRHEWPCRSARLSSRATTRVPRRSSP